ncbi:hypothetical protein DSM104299_00407 [Baekduia alba]|uniref:amidohydrolase family protein n=1 Tax=Baekduia alba TaxID=2997333 RepID=UPI00234208C2|nr:amidohydrolase family protein [Baekduia alba]WCB91731.1 hypothetical protein DSM104299_00407 [Baekduia alba]
MRIDVHTHVIPPELVARTETTGGLFGVRRDGDTLVHPEGFSAPLTADFYDVDALLARMDGNGIDRSVVSLAPPLLFYDLDAVAAVAFAREVNDALVAHVARDPRLAAVAHLPMQDPEAAAEELERAVVLGLRGAQIGTNVGDLPLDDARFTPVLATAERLGVPLILHPYFVGPKPRLEPFFLTNSIGNPLDTAIAAARLIHTGALDRHPGLEVVLVHGAGYLPYQLGRLDHAFRVRPEARAAIERPPSSYLRRFRIDTLTHSVDALRFLAEQAGPDRLLLGTDLPYDMADVRPLDAIAAAGVDADQLGANAAQMLGLGA